MDFLVKRLFSLPKLSGLNFLRLCLCSLFIASVASFFGGSHYYLELLTHFKLQYFVASLLCFLLFVLYQKKTLTILALLLSVVNFYPLYPYMLATEHRVVNRDSATLKVLHSNVLTSNTQYAALRQLIENESPDLVILQELNQGWLNNLRYMGERYPYRITRPREDNFGIALYSKLEIKDYAIATWGALGLPSISAEIELKGKLVTVVATHPMPPISRETFQLRNAQLAEVANYLATLETPKILIGDLNASMWSPSLQALQPQAGLTNVRAGNGLLLSWPTGLLPLMIPIDHILVSDDIKQVSAKTGTHIGSDHLPIIAELSI